MLSQAFLPLLKLFDLAFSSNTEPDATFNPPRFAMTAWNTSPADVGVRVFGATPDRNGMLELSVDYAVDETVPWQSKLLLKGDVMTARNSDFAAISAPGGDDVTVFFVKDDGKLAYARRTDEWTVHDVGGGVAYPGMRPHARTSLGAAMWGPEHMSVFYHDAVSEGTIWESEYVNGTWAVPYGIAYAGAETDINVAGARNSAGELVKAVYVEDWSDVYECTSTAGGRWTKNLIRAFPEQYQTVRFAVTYSPVASNPGHIYYNIGDGTIGELQGSIGNWNAYRNVPYRSNVARTSDVGASLLFPGRSNWVWHVYTAKDGSLWSQTYAQSPAGWRTPVKLVSAST